MQAVHERCVCRYSTMAVRPAGGLGKVVDALPDEYAPMSQAPDVGRALGVRKLPLEVSLASAARLPEAIFMKFKP